MRRRRGEEEVVVVVEVEVGGRVESLAACVL